jgi:hypothetical protein
VTRRAGSRTTGHDHEHGHGRRRVQRSPGSRRDHERTHWSLTFIAARLTLLVLSWGSAIWSVRWAWRQAGGA